MTATPVNGNRHQHCERTKLFSTKVNKRLPGRQRHIGWLQYRSIMLLARSERELRNGN